MVIGSMHYPSLHVVFAWKTKSFISFSVSTCVPVWANSINAHVVSCLNTRGNHGLSCKRSAGRTLRHNYLNDFVYHALLLADFSSTKEPAGLLHTDGKLPDDLIHVSRQAGKSAVWDITVAE